MHRSLHAYTYVLKFSDTLGCYIVVEFIHIEKLDNMI